MRKLIVLLNVLAIILTACGTGKAAESKVLTGYMVIDGDKLYLDEVEIVEREDTDRISELKLGESDMPGGYFIRDLEEERLEFELSNKTTYTFVDFNMLFIKDEKADRLYTTGKKDEFIEHLETSYYDSPPAQRVPFFVEIKEGKVINITEEFSFTI